MNYCEILEGMLFLAGDDGLTLAEIERILEINNCLDVINELHQKYNENSGLELVFLGNRYKLVTNSKYAEYYKKMVDNEVNGPLSQAALEILAIIAYNEPITRGDVDSFRGVDSSYVIRRLLAKGLIKECGRSDLPGRPILYKTTDDFLDYFGLSSKEDLPSVELLEEESNPKDLYTSIYKERDINGRENSD